MIIPEPEEILPMALEARRLGKPYVRFIIPARRRYLERYPYIWDGVRCRTVSKTHEQVRNPITMVDETVVSGLVVEVYATTIIEACRRRDLEARETIARPLRVNEVNTAPNIVTMR